MSEPLPNLTSSAEAHFAEINVAHALEACFAPGSARSVIADGLVRRIQVAVDDDAPGANVVGNPKRYRVHVLLAPLEPETAAMLAAQIRNRLAGLESISRCEVASAPALLPILR